MKNDKADSFKLFTHGEDHFGNKFTLASTTITTTSNVISIGIGLAICHNNDQFCRKTGRNIALNRAANRPLSVVDLDIHASNNDQFETFKKEFFDTKKTIIINGTETFMIRNQ